MKNEIFEKYLHSVDLDNELFGEEEAFRKTDLVLKNGYYHTNVVSPFFTKFSKNRDFRSAQNLHDSLILNGFRYWSSEEEKLRLDGIRKEIPPIMVVTLPKSGSVYIQNNLSISLKIPHIQISLARFPNDYILSESLKIFAMGGAVSQTHLDPSMENLEILHRAGIKHIHVHVRDPRQATVSWAKYLSNEVVGKLSHQRHLADPPLPKGFDELPEAIKFEWFATNHYPSCIRWIVQWLAVSQSDNRFNITFTDHSEFEKSNSGLIKIIVENFGKSMHFDPQKIQEPEVGKAHFRRGLNDEWRDCFTPAIQKWMNSLLPQGLCAKFHWPMA
ncbi:hypothetical protein ACFOGJ_28695 [Marinibaculum pumilum]|uniref:Sulfotransferase domain-containing protein n=1 Tax=Marinibaculum pumilum TaxID=1766165 RepID=A0ABV7LA22_9PROT